MALPVKRTERTKDDDARKAPPKKPVKPPASLAPSLAGGWVTPAVKALLGGGKKEPAPSRSGRVRDDRIDAPRPPVSTGPMVGPASQARAQAAQERGYSDRARREISRTPIDYNPPLAPGVLGQLSEGRISLAPAPDQTTTLAHEFAHNWWERNLNGQNDPQKQRDFLRDTAYATRDSPAARYATDAWSRDRPAYVDYYDDPKVGSNLQIVPNETYARAAEVGTPYNQPDWYRNKWFNGMYREPGSSLEYNPEDGPPDTVYNTTWGKFPVWRKQQGNW